MDTESIGHTRDYPGRYIGPNIAWNFCLNAISTHNSAFLSLMYQPCGILRQQKPPTQETVNCRLYGFDVSGVITVTLFE